ncbi:hypothetical protein O6H91_15G052200 [Diphasiastrum complanatum]|uniref:Uncharacterized protein n=2 Tax=Diphasiastrum complanatum TaxID=34168 RepID=A0ACC2BI96_DIPCM|nr:hypothetical protein O6H91_15G052200 [Diphasiastrum complanatum]
MMKRSGALSKRPEGTDGSDYAFRMTVDDKYKRAAQGRLRLHKIVTAQAAFQVLRALWVGLMAVGGEKLDDIMVASCAFGGAAVLMGTLGIRGSGTSLLKLYILLTVAATFLPFIPIITGRSQRKVSKHWDLSQQTGNYKAVFLMGLELVQDCAATLVQIVGITTAANLTRTLAPKGSL